tara:strand:- start:1317 stop:1958 length:642 start_codon:yes stop_codon:yes gene_type:complete
VSELKIKICGIKDTEVALHAIDCGARYLGFVFFEDSKRNISLKNCRDILDQVKGNVSTVAVTVNPSIVELNNFSKMDFTHVQLHGNENLDYLKKIRDKFDFKIIKSFGISNQEDLDCIETYSPYVDFFLLDSKHHNNVPGGTGKIFDWEIIKNFSVNKTFFLSGGLSIDNIESAINLKKTNYFDVSSGVEVSEGIKDKNLIKEFIIKAQSTIL